MIRPRRSAGPDTIASGCQESAPGALSQCIRRPRSPTRRIRMIRLPNAQHPIHPGRRSRLRAWIAAAGAVLALAGCDDPTGPRLPSEGAPEDLRFAIGGFGATTRSLQMRGDTVVVYRQVW